MNIVKLLSVKNAEYQAYRQVTALFLGDSITHGAFEIMAGQNNRIDQIYDHEAVYHAQFKKLLSGIFPNAPLNVINAGISGSNAAYALKRLERDVFPYSPDLVVVCFGLNDAFSGMAGINSYANALLNIFKGLKEKNIEVVFMTPNMMNTYVSPLLKEELFISIAKNTARAQNEGVMDAYMTKAREVCAGEGVPVCDCYARWKKLSEAGVDTTSLLVNHINHPTREMHKLFAYSLLDTIIT